MNKKTKNMYLELCEATKYDSLAISAIHKYILSLWLIQLNRLKQQIMAQTDS